MSKYDPFKDKVSMYEFCELNYIDYRAFLDEYCKEELTSDSCSHYERWYCERNEDTYLLFTDTLNELTNQ